MQRTPASVRLTFSAVVLAALLWPLANSEAGPPPRADAFPPEIAQSPYQPIREGFGYDPEFASRIYGRKLTFVNFDPAGFPDTETGRAARVALGHLLTHTTLDLTIPLWARLLSQKQHGDLPTQLRELGFLPSPYRYQLEGELSREFEVSGKVQRLAVPYSLSLVEATHRRQDGMAYLGRNCLLCHGGVYGTHVIGGAPNKNFNPEWVLRRAEDGGKFSAFATTWRFSKPFARKLLLAIWLEAAGVKVDGPATLVISDREGDHVVNAEAYFRNVFRKVTSSATNQTVGAQGFPFLSLSTVAHLRANGTNLDDWETPAKVWQADSPLGKLLAVGKNNGVGETTFALVQSRPWWLARYSGHHFWHNMTPDGPRESAPDLALITSIPFHGNPTLGMKERLDMSVRLQSYIRETQSPPFPDPIDHSLATRGLGLYGQHCAKCHGRLERPGKAEGELDNNSRFVLKYDQAKARTAYEVVGTDATYHRHNAALHFLTKHALDNPEAKKLGLHLKMPMPGETPHIYAPPLIGLWASGPYLHNGSVPSVYLVLNSAKRPKYWRLDADPYALDRKHVGVVHESLEALPKTKTQPLDWLVYDTTRTENGMTNVGHRFGDDLSDPERFAVIELLKMLDTRRVEPHVIPGG